MYLLRITPSLIGDRVKLLNNRFNLLSNLYDFVLGVAVFPVTQSQEVEPRQEIAREVCRGVDANGEDVTGYFSGDTV